MNGSNWFKGAGASLTGGEGRKMNALRVFLIVVALHVVVLGPILFFEGCKSAKSTDPQLTETTDPSQPTPPLTVTDPAAVASLPVTPPLPQPMTPAPVTGAIAPVVPGIPPSAAPVAPAPVEPAYKTVKVQPGDSLWKIARAEKVALGDLMRANNLDDKSILRIGQEIKVPAPTVRADTAAAPAAGVAAPAGNETVYVVQQGDSLWAIARKHNTTVEALRAANHLNSNTLKINQKLVIPTASAAPAAPQASVDPLTGGTVRQGEQTLHVMGVGERLENVAKQYNVPVRDIMTANNITDARTVRANARLIIPVKKVAAPAVPAMPEAPAPVPAAPTPMG